MQTEKKGDETMPLTLANPEEKQIIKRIGGKEETRRFLEGMGFVTGGEVTVVSRVGGNVIVSVKGSRVAIGRNMAGKILV